MCIRCGSASSAAPPTRLQRLDHPLDPASSSEYASLMALWVFGYGSLIWRPDIPFDHSELAVLHGYVRRFWQGSTDHRGVPGAPGRVVTLLREPGGRVVGRAFRVPEAQEDEVLASLDHRERGGYDRTLEPLTTLAGAPLAEAVVYRATPDNPNYLGPAPIEAIADQVRRSRGPSGDNAAYVTELADALGTYADDHLRELVEALRRAS